MRTTVKKQEALGMEDFLLLKEYLLSEPSMASVKGNFIVNTDLFSTDHKIVKTLTTTTIEREFLKTTRATEKKYNKEERTEPVKLFIFPFNNSRSFLQSLIGRHPLSVGLSTLLHRHGEIQIPVLLF
jgi:hypothetical protein